MEAEAEATCRVETVIVAEVADLVMMVRASTAESTGTTSRSAAIGSKMKDQAQEKAESTRQFTAEVVEIGAPDTAIADADTETAESVAVEAMEVTKAMEQFNAVKVGTTTTTSSKAKVRVTSKPTW